MPTPAMCVTPLRNICAPSVWLRMCSKCTQRPDYQSRGAHHDAHVQVAKSDAVGLAHAFMHEKKIAPSLTRRVRQHYSQYYTNRGTTLDIQEFMDSLPYDLALELGEALNFTSSRTRRSVMAKVPFLGQLSNDDLIKVGCKLRYVTYNAPVVDIATGKMMVDGFIMKQGDRGKEMFIVLDGMVRIERLLDPVADPNGEPENLGKLVEVTAPSVSFLPPPFPPFSPPPPPPLALFLARSFHTTHTRGERERERTRAARDSERQRACALHTH
jgi:hypothetical protein